MKLLVTVSISVLNTPLLQTFNKKASEECMNHEGQLRIFLYNCKSCAMHQKSGTLLVSQNAT